MYATAPAPPAPAGAPTSNGSRNTGVPIWAWIAIGALALTTVTFAGLYFTKNTDSASASTAQGKTGSGEAQPTGDRFQTGTYKLPGGMPPGLYRVDTDWQTFREDGGLIGDSSTRDGTTLLLIAEDAPKGEVKLMGGAWPVDKSKPIDALQYLDGTYLVGVDIQPGTYRMTAVESMPNIAYAARLDENLEIIDNKLENGSEAVNEVTMEILPTDFAFEFTGRIEKVG